MFTEVYLWYPNACCSFVENAKVYNTNTIHLKENVNLLRDTFIKLTIFLYCKQESPFSICLQCSVAGFCFTCTQRILGDLWIRPSCNMTDDLIASKS